MHALHGLATGASCSDFSLSCGRLRLAEVLFGSVPLQACASPRDLRRGSHALPSARRVVCTRVPALCSASSGCQDAKASRSLRHPFKAGPRLRLRFGPPSRRPSPSLRFALRPPCLSSSVPRGRRRARAYRAVALQSLIASQPQTCQANTKQRTRPAAQSHEIQSERKRSTSSQEQACQEQSLACHAEVSFSNQPAAGAARDTPTPTVIREPFRHRICNIRHWRAPGARAGERRREGERSPPPKKRGENGGTRLGSAAARALLLLGPGERVPAERDDRQQDLEAGDLWKMHACRASRSLLPNHCSEWPNKPCFEGALSRLHVTDRSRTGHEQRSPRDKTPTSRTSRSFTNRRARTELFSF